MKNLKLFWKSSFSSVLVLLFVLSIGHTASAQTKEFGVRMTGLNDFAIVYKKQKGEHKYLRNRLTFTNLSFSDIGHNNNYGLSIGFAIGTERRKPISNRFYFIHGLEPVMTFGITKDRSYKSYSFLAGLGYVLGCQYDFNPSFYISLETIPSISFWIDGISGGTTSYNFNAGFSNQAAAVTLAYRFSVD